MEYFASLNFGEHEESFHTFQNTIEVQVKVIFEETFPFKELDELVSIVEKAEQLERFHILPKVINAVQRIKIKFSNSLSPEYETWIVKVENSINLLSLHLEELQTVFSLPE